MLKGLTASNTCYVTLFKVFATVNKVLVLLVSKTNLKSILHTMRRNEMNE